MKRTFRTVTALMLVLSLLLGLAPAETIGALASSALAETSIQEATTPSELSGALTEARDLMAGGGSRASGYWQYVVLSQSNYAVITGYTGSLTSSLKMPDLLDGYDVVGVLSEALYSLRGLRDIEIPGNILTMGAKALPVGCTVKATSGSYAQAWAKKNGHAFSTTSAYQFVPGVVDFTGIREENFNRVDANEVWLRSLEALRLSAGSLFFLLDPANMYQISYYRVTSIEAGAAGFVVVRCETPDIDEVLLEY